MSDELNTTPPIAEEDFIKVGSEIGEEKPKNDAPPSLENSYSSRRQHRRNRFACVFLGMMVAVPLTCCSCLIACLAIFGAFEANAHRNRITREETYTMGFDSGDDITIEIHNEVGATVVRGEDNLDEIEIVAEFSATGITKTRAQENVDAMQVETRREDGRYIIETLQNEGGNFDNSSVNLEIRVPQHLNLMVTNEVGAIEVKDVEINNIMTLSNDIGRIKFEGRLGEEGDYRITSSIGEIEVELDDPQNMRIEARSEVGSVEVGLDLSPRQETEDGVSRSIVGILGDDDDPDATLTVQSEVGRISVKD